MVWSWSGHSPPLSHTGQSSGWLRSRNSSTPSWAFLAGSESVYATIPSLTGCMQDGTINLPRGVSISTRHMRHIPTGFMRGCQQKRGM